MVNQTGEILNPGRPFRLQVKKGVDPSRARSLLGRILIGTLDNDMSDENIESLFSRVPMPNKFADPPESCVNWALCAIMHLQIFGEVARFDRRLFSDWVLDYADRQLLRYQGEAMMEVATYGAEQENEQRDRDRVQSELQAIDWASVDIPEESRPNVAMGLLTPEECSRALVALVALWGSKLPGGKRMAMIEGIYTMSQLVLPCSRTKLTDLFCSATGSHRRQLSSAGSGNSQAGCLHRQAQSPSVSRDPLGHDK